MPSWLFSGKSDQWPSGTGKSHWQQNALDAQFMRIQPLEYIPRRTSMSDIMPSLAAGDVVTIGGRCFTIVGEIGRGSFGIVFSAVEVATGARIALKLRCYTAPMLRDDAQEIDEDEDEHEQELLRTVPFDVVLANATRDEVVAQERAAAAERAAPAVIAWAGNVIVMDLIDSATHATLSFLIWSSFTSAADDFTAEQQLAVVAVLAKLHHAGVPYDNADMFGSVFVPLRPECGGAFLVDHKPRRRRPGSVWRALVAQFCRHGNPLRMVSGVLREHREWFGVDDTTVPPEQWAEFVSLQDAVRADCGVSFARPEGFDDCVYALLTAAAPAAGIAAGGEAMWSHRGHERRRRHR